MRAVVRMVVRVAMMVMDVAGGRLVVMMVVGIGVWRVWCAVTWWPDV